MRGSLFIFELFDVSEAIRMDELDKLLGGEVVRRDVAPRQVAQTQVWFEPPPAIRSLGDIEFLPGERFQGEMHY